MCNENTCERTPANMETNRPLHLKLLMTIVDRGKGQTAVNLLLADGVLFHRIVLGRGTAKTEILDLLGIGETSKDIVLTVLPEWHVHRALHKLKNTLQFDNPGHGIAFTIPISSIGGRHALAMLDAAAEPGPVSDGKENQNMVGNAKPHELIIAIVDSGHADDVMDAARPAGARGGTVLHARGASVEEAEKFFGITIQPEKEMLLILTKHEDKRAIMEAVCQAAGRSTDANGVVFSLPVEDVIGAARLLREEEA